MKFVYVKMKYQVWNINLVGDREKKKDNRQLILLTESSPIICVKNKANILLDSNQSTNFNKQNTI